MKTAEKAFLRRFWKVMDEVPVSDEEADAVLAAVGIDPDAALQRAQVRVESFLQKEKNDPFATVDRQRRDALERWSQVKVDKRPRAELLARVAALRSQGFESQVFHRKLEAMTDNDLASYVAQLEELARREKKD